MTDKLELTINQRLSWLKNRDILRDRITEAQLLAHNGSMFSADPLLISYVQGLLVHGLSEAVILDINQNPCKIDNLTEFQQSLIEHNQRVMNLYYQDYIQLKQVRRIG